MLVSVNQTKWMEIAQKRVSSLLKYNKIRTMWYEIRTNFSCLKEPCNQLKLVYNKDLPLISYLGTNWFLIHSEILYNQLICNQKCQPHYYKCCYRFKTKYKNQNNFVFVKLIFIKQNHLKENGLIKIYEKYF